MGDLDYYTVFSNDGEIDVRAITTIGVSAKEEGAVGFFGSGLKYSIAILIREGCDVVIYSGTSKYEFTTEPTTIRGKEFGIVHMNGQPLGFTTELGKTWDMWMACREILCNCEDEKGDHYSSVGLDSIDVQEGTTHVVVKGRGFYNEYENRDDWYLNKESKTLLYSDDNIEIYEGVTNSLFYKGVKVSRSVDPMLATYNILSHTELTEDRTLKNEGFWFNWTMGDYITRCTNYNYINSLLNCGEGFLEHGIYYPEASEISTALQEEGRKIADVVNQAPPCLMKKLAPSLEESLKSKSSYIMDDIQKAKYDKACDFLERAGHPVIYPVKVCELGDGMYGLADTVNSLIYIDPKCFEKGTEWVVRALYEENMHIKYKVADFTREFQNTVIGHLINMMEKVLNEPL